MDGCSLDGCSLDGCSLDGYFGPGNKIPMGETRCLSIFGLPPCVTGTPPWLLRPVKASTSSELYPNTYDYLPLTVQNLCYLRDTIPRHWSPGASYPICPNPLPREAEDFPRGDRYFKSVPPLRYLIYLSPKVFYW